MCLFVFSLWIGSAWAWEAVIGAITLHARLGGPQPPLILDVRGREAYLGGTIAGALDAGTDPVGFLPDSRGGEAVLIVPEGAASEGWRARLRRFGYRVLVLEGGIEGWRTAGFSVAMPEAGFVRPGTVPFVIPRGLCEMNEPAQVFE
jgi:rhodanese-related sulfurtransferase